MLFSVIPVFSEFRTFVFSKKNDLTIQAFIQQEVTFRYWTLKI